LDRLITRIALSYVFFPRRKFICQHLQESFSEKTVFLFGHNFDLTTALSLGVSQKSAGA
jgi:hypothetical protein